MPPDDVERDPQNFLRLPYADSGAQNDISLQHDTLKLNVALSTEIVLRQAAQAVCTSLGTKDAEFEVEDAPNEHHMCGVWRCCMRAPDLDARNG